MPLSPRMPTPTSISATGDGHDARQEPIDEGSDARKEGHRTVDVLQLRWAPVMGG